MSVNSFWCVQKERGLRMGCHMTGQVDKVVK